MGESFTATVECGGILPGTSISSEDTIQSIIKNMVYEQNPNRRYFSTNLGTWSSTADVDTFLSLHNHNNEYGGLALGNYVRINDGTYNKDWVIAGFDMEYNQLAADGTTYDNGYGICMIPKTDLGVKMQWNSSNTISNGYMYSAMNRSNLVTVANNLKTVLGSHLVLRNVLLSRYIDTNKYSASDEWTTSYCTLMSAGQLTGTFAQNRNKYDDGEANYKLPLFDHEEYKTGNPYWLRGIWGIYSGDYNAYDVESSGFISSSYVTFTGINVRPLIYLR